eukprot:gene3672-3721_t
MKILSLSRISGWTGGRSCGVRTRALHRGQRGTGGLIRTTDQMDVDPLRGLTEKQRQVLDLLIQHKTSKEISRMLGISPHTVDQRILLARAKLQVTSRNEVAQAYRHLLIELGIAPGGGIYQQSIYGPPDIAGTAQTRHTDQREAAGESSSGAHPPDTVRAVPAPAADTGYDPAYEPAYRALVSVRSVQSLTNEAGRGYYHVLPEAFDGPGGTLLRLGAIAMITVFLTLVILGGLTIYMQLSHLLARISGPSGRLLCQRMTDAGGIGGRLHMTTQSHSAKQSMSNTVAQQRISRDLREAEAALDEALLRQARLLSTMVHARRETDVSPFLGQDAMMRLLRSQQAMLNAGGELARVHGRLSDIAEEMLIGTDPCPTPAFGLADSADDAHAFDADAGEIAALPAQPRAA